MTSEFLPPFCISYLKVVPGVYPQKRNVLKLTEENLFDLQHFHHLGYLLCGRNDNSNFAAYYAEHLFHY